MVHVQWYIYSVNQFMIHDMIYDRDSLLGDLWRLQLKAVESQGYLLFPYLNINIYINDYNIVIKYDHLNSSPMKYWGNKFLN